MSQSQLPVNKDTSSVSEPKVIKSVFYEDFQGHANTKIILAPPGQVTALVGPTDAGKTSLVRGLRLVLYNVPQGSEFVRVGRNQATVGIEMGSGIKVFRDRSRGSVNRYRVVKPGATDGGDKYEGFGNAVPQEVVDVTGVRLVKVGEKDVALNLSEQLDGPFLGSSVSSPERARILGKLAGTEEVDEAQKTLGTDIYRANQEKGRLEDEIEGLEERIAEYGWLEDLKERCDAADVVIGNVRKAQEKRDQLVAARTGLNDVARRQLVEVATLNRWANLDRLVLIVEGHVQPAADKAQTLKGLRIELTKNAASQAAWQPILRRLAHLAEAEAAYNVASEASGKAVALRSLRESLTATEAGMQRATSTIDRWQGLDAAGRWAISIDHVVTTVGELRRIARDLRDNADFQANQKATLARYATVDDAGKVASHVADIITKAANLRVLLSAINDNTSRQSAESSRLSRLGDVEGAAAHITHVESRSTFLATLRQLSRDLTRNRESQVVAEEAAKRQAQALSDAEKTYMDTLIFMKICPLCGSEITESGLRRAV